MLKVRYIVKFSWVNIKHKFLQQRVKSACKSTISALNGCDKLEILNTEDIPGELSRENAGEDIHGIAKGSYKKKKPPEIRGTGYVVDALEAALWAFNGSDSFEEGALLAVNLGDDADTTGAIYGQLAGAYYGLAGIPLRWRQLITQAHLINDYADDLLLLSVADNLAL